MRHGLVVGLGWVVCLAISPAFAQEGTQWEPREGDAGDFRRNLFRGAKTACSCHPAGYKANELHTGMAVDGNRGNEGGWRIPKLPSHLTVTLDAPAEINLVRLWPGYVEGDCYQWRIEGSLDGEAWTTLVDGSGNKTRGTERGFAFVFPKARVLHLRITVLSSSSSNAAAGARLLEVEGYLLPPEELKEMETVAKSWEGIAPGLHAAVGSLDRRYARDAAPEVDEKSRVWKATAWRGERVAGHVVTWSPDPLSQLRVEAPCLRGPGESRVPLRAQFTRYVYGAGRLLEDILDPVERLDTPGRTCRPVWVSIDVPQDAAPGTYTGQVRILAAGERPVVLDVALEVLAARLPPPAQWKFHLLLEQNPYAVARYHGVAPWSEAHLLLMREVLRMGAEAGVKCLLVTLNDGPGGQWTHDPLDSMIAWTKTKEGGWAYDYAVFDRYVELADTVGAARQIDCYSLVPWGNDFYYRDEATGDRLREVAAPGSEAYRNLLTPFLKDFERHLREKGWLDRLCIMLDERSLAETKAALALLREAAPGIRLALGANQKMEAVLDDVQYCCFCLLFRPDPALNARRAREGKITAFYVCGTRPRACPDTLPDTAPAEATWFGWYAAAHQYDGFARWALCHWNRDPFQTTDQGPFPTGDTFLIYPGPRSSIRFERLREGVQDYEKIRILRERLGEDPELGRLDRELAGFTWLWFDSPEEWQRLKELPELETPERLTERMNQAKAVLTELSRKIRP